MAVWQLNKMRRWRSFLLSFLFLGLAATILGRLAFLQIKKYKFYQALGEGQQKILEKQRGKRGEIFFSNGEPLAVNKTGKYLFISPREIKDKEETTQVLSQILDLDNEWLLTKVQKNNLFESIKHDISEQEERLIRENDLEGVYIEEEIFRYYPQKNLASHVVGFVGGENTGQYGVEGYYNELLSGKEILREKEKGPFGFFLNTKEENSGTDIYLTLDPLIQAEAERLLLENQERIGYKSGQILALEPRSGEIIALAQVPGFDPNLYFENKDPEIFQNAVVQKIYEPGSVFKPITMAGALNEKRVTPQTTYIDNGLVKIGGWTVYNYAHRTWGEQTMTRVLEMSINTGAIFAERELGDNLFLDYIEKFGLFGKTGVDLQGEVFSQNSELKKGYEINFATASFGQGIEITPIQLAQAFTAIANNGKMTSPHILKKTYPPITQKNRFEEEEIISSKTASELTTMLISVIENGSGKAARIDGYHIAGKTGTAQVPWSALGIQKSGYSPETTQTFIGFGPALNPEFLILVKLDNPKTKTAEYSSTPIFQQLAKYIIDLWEIPPDYEE